MTDRLSTLLHAEGAALDIPPVPDGIVAAGRREVHRRRARTALVGAVAVLLVAVGASVAVGHWLGGPDSVQPADQLAYEQNGAWARGDEVHVGNHVVVVPGTQTLQYSSAGVVVAAKDGYVLVRPDGRVEDLDLGVISDPFRLPAVGTEPTTANLAYVRAVGADRAQLVVHDLGTGEETAVTPAYRTTQPDPVSWLSGDLVASFRNGHGVILDWRTGEKSPTPRTGWWQSADVSVDYDTDGTWTLRTFDGDQLLTVTSPDPASTYGTLSPDGRYFAVSDAEPRFAVYDLASGRSTVFDDRALPDYGWTPDGHLIGSSTTTGGEVEVCDPATRSCEGTGTTAGGQLTVVAGEPGATP